MKQTRHYSREDYFKNNQYHLQNKHRAYGIEMNGKLLYRQSYLVHKITTRHFSITRFVFPNSILRMLSIIPWFSVFLHCLWEHTIFCTIIKLLIDWLYFSRDVLYLTTCQFHFDFNLSSREPDGWTKFSGVTILDQFDWLICPNNTKWSIQNFTSNNETKFDKSQNHSTGNGYVQGTSGKFMARTRYKAHVWVPECYSGPIRGWHVSIPECYTWSK